MTAHALIWLLDTNIISKAIREDGPLRKRLRAHHRDSLAVSAVTVAELEYGSLKSPQPDHHRARWRLAIADLIVLPFAESAAMEHARLRLVLRHQPIGERDLLIAAIALANDLGVVTNNFVEFKRVPRLKVEDWSR